MSDNQTTDLPAWDAGVDMTFMLTAEDDSEGLVGWLRRVAATPDLRVRDGAHVECQPSMLVEAADEIERARFEAASWKDQMEGCHIQWRRAAAEAKAFFARTLELEAELRLAKKAAGKGN